MALLPGIILFLMFSPEKKTEVPLQTNTEASAALPSTPVEILPAEKMKVIDIPDGTISLSDDNFASCYDELYDNREEYYGRNIDVSGYVMTRAGLRPDQFLIGRYLVWCCDSDQYFIGFLVIAEGTVPQPNSAVRIQGILEAADYLNPEDGKTFLVPAIRAESIVPAQGVSERVYP